MAVIMNFTGWLIQVRINNTIYLSLIDILDQVQRDLAEGNNEEARTRMGKFISKVIDGSNPERGDPPRIPLDDAKDLICAAASLLQDIGLE
jgi:hypothetical protein